MNHLTLRCSLLAALAIATGEAAALGLGELRGTPTLGERPRMEADILGGDRVALDATCYQLRKPTSDSGLPWLKQGTLTVRRGKPPVLEIRSHLPVNDPVLEIAIHIGCGFDVTREYEVLVSPPNSAALKAPSVMPKAPPPAASRAAAAARAAPSPKLEPPPPVSGLALSAPKAVEEAAKPAAPVPGEAAMSAEDRIRTMQARVGELEQRAADLTQRLEEAAPQAAPAAEAGTAAAPAAPAAAPAAPAAAPAAPAAAPAAPAAAPARPTPPAPAKGGSDWTLYAALIVALLAVGAWLAWRSRRESRLPTEDETVMPIEVDPQRKGERDELGGAELEVEPSKMAMPVKLEMVQPPARPSALGGGRLHDSTMSIAAATVDEHFESNPVMELAEIMLSFGRVKGAAQALQEYIDANPQEALKPWMRLLDVYRMGGMREEFDKVASDLNKHFNVQVQPWDEMAVASPNGGGEVDVVLDSGKQAVGDAVAPAIRGVEDMPHIIGELIGRWGAGDVVEYMDRLLRDNRGGTRIGFPLSVVSDLLFLIDLKEISNQLERDARAS